MARALIGCQSVAAASWRLSTAELGQLQGKLPELQLSEEQLGQLQSQLQLLTESGRVSLTVAPQ